MIYLIPLVIGSAMMYVGFRAIDSYTKNNSMKFDLLSGVMATLVGSVCFWLSLFKLLS